MTLLSGAHALSALPAVNPQDPRLSRYFRAMRVLRVDQVTPLMRRITLGGAPLEGFDFECPPDCLAPHVHLEIPPEGVTEPEWPLLRGPDDMRVTKPDGPSAPVERTYSVRSVDVARGELAVDVFLHGDGPGSRFGAYAKPGMPCGVWSPHGTTLPPTDWFLIGGDQTALPGIAWILESLPADARGQVFIEVADVGEQQPLACPTGMELTWLHLGSAVPGTSQRLADAVIAARWPRDASPFLWFGAEAGAARRVRRHARHELKLDRKRFDIVNYWKRGAAEGEFHAMR